MILRKIVAVVSLLFFYACGSSPQGPSENHLSNISISPSTANLEVGEGQPFSAQATDPEGNPLPGVSFSWNSSNPEVATVNHEGRVTTIDTGNATITASAQGVSGSSELTVTEATVEGRVVPALNNGETGELIAFITKEGKADSTRVSSSGQFKLETNLAYNWDHLCVANQRTSERNYFPSCLLGKDSINLHTRRKIGLVPTSLTIEEGIYEGQTMQVSMDAAYTPIYHDGGKWDSFFRMSWSESGDSWIYPVASWPESQEPFTIGFNREESDVEITASDSTEFWEVIREAERYLGLDSLFVPTDFSGGDVEFFIDRGLGKTGYGSQERIDSEGNILSGELVLGRIDIINSDPHILIHELIHLLFFGHTCEWASIMAKKPEDGSRCAPEGEKIPKVPSKKGVAYMQLFYRVHKATKDKNLDHSLPEALFGERIVMLGKSPELDPPTN